jgi:pimeloyl-ACP methyl ester carboxylesterase
MAAFPFLKSTTVRVHRAFFRVGEILAPRLAARVATRMWFRIPAAAAATELPSGGIRFHVVSQGASVRGHHWGDGPVVYLVHGWGGRGSQLAAYVEPLMRRGYRVVLFDSPSHGASDPGPSGRRSSNGVEFGKALDAVAARFGPAQAVIAHSMGAISTVLTLKYGWLSTQRLVLMAPMASFSSQFRPVQRTLAIGPRTRRHVEHLTARRVGVPVEEFDLGSLLADVDTVPTLVVHDRDDRQTSFTESRRLAATLPDASFVATRGLGHQRLLRDGGVTRTVVGFVDGEDFAVGVDRAVFAETA